jgi:hypothetical protein
VSHDVLTSTQRPLNRRFLVRADIALEEAPPPPPEDDAPAPAAAEGEGESKPKKKKKKDKPAAEAEPAVAVEESSAEPAATAAAAATAASAPAVAESVAPKRKKLQDLDGEAAPVCQSASPRFLLAWSECLWFVLLQSAGSPPASSMDRMFDSNSSYSGAAGGGVYSGAAFEPKKLTQAEKTGKPWIRRKLRMHSSVALSCSVLSGARSVSLMHRTCVAPVCRAERAVPEALRRVPSVPPVHVSVQVRVRLLLHALLALLRRRLRQLLGASGDLFL